MKKIPYTSSVDIFSHIELSEEAVLAVQCDASPEEVIAQLNQAECYIDLVHFFAHALPMREAIWWCVQALRLRQPDWSLEESKLIDDCERWVREPNEGQRRLIESQLQELKDDRAPKWLGQAVFWSGTGSIAPADNPVVMPVEYLYAKAVAGAVNTAAVIPEWKAKEKAHRKYYQGVFQMALDVANGGTGTTKQGGEICHALLD